MHEPPSKITQGHETVYSTNILGPFLLTKLLTPILKETADRVGETRVCWAGSAHTEFLSPTGGVTFVPGDDQESLLVTDKYTNYNISKAASYFLGMEYAARHTKDNILSVVSLPPTLSAPPSPSLRDISSPSIQETSEPPSNDTIPTSPTYLPSCQNCSYTIRSWGLILSCTLD